MKIALKAGDELEYCILKTELGVGSYSFTPYTVNPTVDVEFEVPKLAIYIRHNTNVLTNLTLKEFKQKGHQV